MMGVKDIKHLELVDTMPSVRIARLAFANFAQWSRCSLKVEVPKRFRHGENAFWLLDRTLSSEVNDPAASPTLRLECERIGKITLVAV